MVNISDVLEKAGYGEGVEERKDDESSSQPEPPAPAIEAITPPSPKDTKAKAAKESSGQWDERLFKAVNENAYLPEVFKTLRSRILHPMNGGSIPRTIMVTSAIPKEGKSFIAANLAISLAHGVDQHCLLVDCDLRRPSLAKMFGMDNTGGLVDYLRDNVEMARLIGKTSLPKLSLLASGKPPVNPAELLCSSRMQSLVDELSKRYEDRTIIIDTPPMLVAAETTVLARQVDTVLVVVRQDKSSKAQIQKLVDTIGAEKILGMVFNDYTVNILEKTVVKGYGYYNYNYHAK
jgi:protein-tyrosine kinase